MQLFEDAGQLQYQLVVVVELDKALAGFCEPLTFDDHQSVVFCRSPHWAYQ